MSGRQVSHRFQRFVKAGPAGRAAPALRVGPCNCPSSPSCQQPLRPARKSSCPRARSPKRCPARVRLAWYYYQDKKKIQPSNAGAPPPFERWQRLRSECASRQAGLPAACVLGGPYAGRRRHGLKKLCRACGQFGPKSSSSWHPLALVRLWPSPQCSAISCCVKRYHPQLQAWAGRGWRQAAPPFPPLR